MPKTPLYLTEKSVFDNESVFLVDYETYRKLGTVEPIEHGNFKAVVFCGRKKGQAFSSWSKDICEGWLASIFYSKRKGSS